MTYFWYLNSVKKLSLAKKQEVKAVPLPFISQQKSYCIFSFCGYKWKKKLEKSSLFFTQKYSNKCYLMSSNYTLPVGVFETGVH